MLSLKLVFIIHGLLICSYVDEIDNLCVLYNMRQFYFQLDYFGPRKSSILRNARNYFLQLEFSPL